VNNENTICLNLGCGSSPKAGWVNLDNRALAGVDIVRDILRGLPFSDGAISNVYSENFLEHLPQHECIWVMNEIHRVLRSGGTAHHLVPVAGSTNFFQDPTHLSHWIPETLTYFQQSHRRNLYYGGAILAWVLEEMEIMEPNKVMNFKLRKP
jgi:SAM-dependent methyltransferase